MEEHLPMPEPQPETPQVLAMSLVGRLLNVFATPADVFQEVKAAKVAAMRKEVAEKVGRPDPELDAAVKAAAKDRRCGCGAKRSLIGSRGHL